MEWNLDCQKGATGVQGEVAFLLAHPESAFTDQNQRILRLLAQPHFADGASQYDIGYGALDLDPSFQPDVDTNVRVAMSRLRKSLDRFYDRCCRFRPQRLTIPFRKYCLELREIGPFLETSHRNGRESPSFGWTVTAGSASRHKELAFHLETTFPAYLAQAPLLHDGAMRSEWISAKSINNAMDLVRESPMRYLVEFVVGDASSIRVWQADDSSLFTSKTFTVVGSEQPAVAISRDAIVYLTDPLTGVMTSLLTAEAPTSRLAVAKSFFRFMASQDRALLIPAKKNLTEIKGTRLDSPLTMALRADVARASYCFATCPAAEPSTKHLDETERALDMDPYQPYAWLAHSYYGMMMNGAVTDRLPFPEKRGVDWFGSTRADLDLFHTLVGRREKVDYAESAPDSFFELATRFLNHFSAAEYDEAAEVVSSSAPSEKFWTSVFSCAVSVELGKKETAMRAFLSLKADVPEFEDFAGRAILKMIPDESISKRISL